MRLTNRRITNLRAVRVKDIGDVWTTWGICTTEIKRCARMNVEDIIAAMTTSAILLQVHAIADGVDVERDVRTRNRGTIRSFVVPKACLAGRRTLADDSKQFD